MKRTTAPTTYNCYTQKWKSMFCAETYWVKWFQLFKLNTIINEPEHDYKPFQQTISLKLIQCQTWLTMIENKSSRNYIYSPEQKITKKSPTSSSKCCEQKTCQTFQTSQSRLKKTCQNLDFLSPAPLRKAGLTAQPQSSALRWTK